MHLEKNSGAFPTVGFKTHGLKCIVDQSCDKVKQAILFCFLVCVQPLEKDHFELIECIVIEPYKENEQDGYQTSNLCNSINKFIIATMINILLIFQTVKRSEEGNCWIGIWE